MWLIRKISGEIEGPFSEPDFKSRFISGKIDPDSEICPENSYWINFHEMDELKKHFSHEEISRALNLGAGSLVHGESTRQIDLTKPIERTPKKPENEYKEEDGFFESRQIFTVLFFGGVISAILAVVWLLNRLHS